MSAPARMASGNSSEEGWSGLPLDLLNCIVQLLQNNSYPSSALEDVQRCLLVCKAWHTAIKGLLHSLSPSVLLPAGHPAVASWRGIQQLHMTPARTKYDTFILTPPLYGVSSSSSLTQFAASLQQLSIQGYDFTQCDDPALLSGMLGTVPQLMALDLSYCRVQLDQLTASVPQLHQLKSLDLAGVQGETTSCRGPIDKFLGPSKSHALLATAKLVALASTVHLNPAKGAAGHCPSTTLLTRSCQELISALAGLPSLTHLDLSMQPARRVGALRGTSNVKLQGLAMATLGVQLSHLSKLQTLKLAYNRLAAADYPLVGQLTQLQHLSVCWSLGAMAEAPSMHSGPQDWQHSVANLHQLQSLQIDMHGSLPSVTSSRILSVAHLTALQELALLGCSCLALVMSALHLQGLERVAIRHTLREAFAPELIVQLANNNSMLRHLDLSFSTTTGFFELPGDVILRGLAHVRPQLASFTAQGLDLHGSGLRAEQQVSSTAQADGASSSHATVRQESLCQLHELVLHAEKLSLYCYQAGLAHLTGLRSLTLTGIRPRHLANATQRGCLQALSTLTALTSLHLLDKQAITDIIDQACAMEPRPLGSQPPAHPPQSSTAQGNEVAKLQSLLQKLQQGMEHLKQRHTKWLATMVDELFARTAWFVHMLPVFTAQPGAQQAIVEATASVEAPHVFGVAQMLGCVVWHLQQVLQHGQQHVPLQDLLYIAQELADLELETIPDAPPRVPREVHAPSAPAPVVTAAHAQQPQQAAQQHEGSSDESDESDEFHDASSDENSGESSGSTSNGSDSMSDVEMQPPTDEGHMQVEPPEQQQQHGSEGSVGPQEYGHAQALGAMEVQYPEEQQQGYTQSSAQAGPSTSQRQHGAPQSSAAAGPSTLPQQQQQQLLQNMAQEYAQMLQQLPEEPPNLDDVGGGWIMIDNIPVNDIGQDGPPDDELPDFMQPGPAPVAAAAGPPDLVGQQNLVRALTRSQADSQEPHVHWLSLMPSLKVLTIEALRSTGQCLMQLTVVRGNVLQNLKQLTLRGTFQLNASSLSALQQLRLPQLESFTLTRCMWPYQQLPRQQTEDQQQQQASKAPPCARELLSTLMLVMPGLRNLVLGGCEGLLPSSLTQLAQGWKHLRYLQLYEVQRGLARPEVFLPAFNSSSQLHYVRASHHRMPEAPGGVTFVRGADGQLQAMP